MLGQESEKLSGYMSELATTYLTNGYDIGYKIRLHLCQKKYCPGQDHNHSSCVVIFIIGLAAL